MPRSTSDRAAARRSRSTPSEPTFGGRRLVQILLAFVACILLVDALAGENGFLDTMRAHRQYRDMATAVARLEQENDALRAQARLLREDPKTIEDIARRDLGLIRPGEVLFIVKDIELPAGLTE